MSHGRWNSLIALPYRSAETDFPVVDPKVEPAVRIGADPRLVGNRRALPPIIGKWNQGSLGALLTTRPFLDLHASSGAKLRAAQPLPLVRIAKGVGELEHCLEVGFSVARLSDEESNIDEGVNDPAEIFGAIDTPMRENPGCQQPELLPGEVAAGPSQLGGAHMTACVETGLQKLYSSKHEHVRALMILPTPSTNARHDIVSKLQLVHRRTSVELITGI